MKITHSYWLVIIGFFFKKVLISAIMSILSYPMIVINDSGFMSFSFYSMSSGFFCVFNLLSFVLLEWTFLVCVGLL